MSLGLYLSNTQKIGIEMDCIWLSSITVWGLRGQRENQVFLRIKYFNPIQFKPSYQVNLMDFESFNLKIIKIWTVKSNFVAEELKNGPRKFVYLCRNLIFI